MKNKIPYNNSGIWGEYDFLINKYYWIKQGIPSAYQIRKDNIADVRRVLNKYNVKNWIQGKTLKGIFLEGKLINDHDDDFGVFIEDTELIKSKVIDELVSLGFSLIRDVDGIISIERSYRYVDLCLFEERSASRVGYVHKEFDKYHFEQIETVAWEGIELGVPSNSHDLITKMYRQSAFEFPKKIIRKIVKVFNNPEIFFKKVQGRLPRLPVRLISMFSFLLPLINMRVRIINKAEFLNMNIEPVDSFNWKWRARHLNVVTNDGKFTKVGDIIKHLSLPENVSQVEDEIVETRLYSVFRIPANLDMDFWWGGNNFFWYCIKYRFRRNVAPYHKANDYIQNKKKPELYTSEYYSSLGLMTNDEIKNLLASSFIEIEDNSVIGGKHRVFAMIGRLVSGEEFIPFKVIDFNYRQYK